VGWGPCFSPPSLQRLPELRRVTHGSPPEVRANAAAGGAAVARDGGALAAGQRRGAARRVRGLAHDDAGAAGRQVCAHEGRAALARPRRSPGAHVGAERGAQRVEQILRRRVGVRAGGQVGGEARDERVARGVAAARADLAPSRLPRPHPVRAQHAQHGSTTLVRGGVKLGLDARVGVDARPGRQRARRARPRRRPQPARGDVRPKRVPVRGRGRGVGGGRPRVLEPARAAFREPEVAPPRGRHQVAAPHVGQLVRDDEGGAGGGGGGWGGGEEEGRLAERDEAPILGGAGWGAGLGGGNGVGSGAGPHLASPAPAPAPLPHLHRARREIGHRDQVQFGQRERDAEQPFVGGQGGRRGGGGLFAGGAAGRGAGARPDAEEAGGAGARRAARPRRRRRPHHPLPRLRQLHRGRVQAADDGGEQVGGHGRGGGVERRDAGRGAVAAPAPAALRRLTRRRHVGQHGQPPLRHQRHPPHRLARGLVPARHRRARRVGLKLRRGQPARRAVAAVPGGQVEPRQRGLEREGEADGEGQGGVWGGARGEAHRRLAGAAPEADVARDGERVRGGGAPPPHPHHGHLPPAGAGRVQDEAARGGRADGERRGDRARDRGRGPEVDVPLQVVGHGRHSIGQAPPAPGALGVARPAARRRDERGAREQQQHACRRGRGRGRGPAPAGGQGQPPGGGWGEGDAEEGAAG